jgi:hypothetical protein
VQKVSKLFIAMQLHSCIRNGAAIANQVDRKHGMGEPPDMQWPAAEMEDAVKQYLAEHPEAMDTIEGIAEWWLMRQQIRIEMEALISALNRLTDDGVLERIDSGGEARYRLKKNRLGDLEAGRASLDGKY